MPLVFFFNDTATTEIYALSLHDALPISLTSLAVAGAGCAALDPGCTHDLALQLSLLDRKSTRLNSSHQIISYAVFCLKTEEHTSELQSPDHLVCPLLLEKRKTHLIRPVD